jgi:hypothetical protein
MTIRSRRQLENQVAEAIEREAEATRRARLAEERAARSHDIRAGVLAIHQPHAQPPTQGVGEPVLYCTAGCMSTWPCETVEFLFSFGKYAGQDPTD